jgi:hypothetical protein
VGKWLKTISVKGAGDLMHDGIRQNTGSPQFPFPLGGHAAGEVAGAGPAMLDLTGGGQTEAFLGSLVGLLLRHIVTGFRAAGCFTTPGCPGWKPRIIGKGLKVRKRDETDVLKTDGLSQLPLSGFLAAQVHASKADERFF